MCKAMVQPPSKKGEPIPPMRQCRMTRDYKDGLCEIQRPDYCRLIDSSKSENEAGKIDAVNNPKHYTSHPSGIECIQITEHMNFNLGNAVKYIWRAGIKSIDPAEDLKKAAFYIKREIQRIERFKNNG